MLDLLALGDAGWGDELLRGAGVTLLVALGAFTLGLALGLAGAAARLADPLPVRGLAELYTTVFRGVPELLVIYLFFFGSGPAIAAVAGLFGYAGPVRPDTLAIAVVALGVISGAYSTEVLRGAVLAVPRGQIEAGRALGMPRRLLARRILLPQTLRLALPGLGNVWQITLKDTALISVMAVAELMRMANVAAGSTRQPFIFYLAAAGLYLAMTTASQIVYERLERRLGRAGPSA